MIVSPPVRMTFLAGSAVCWALAIFLIAGMLAPQKQPPIPRQFQTSFLSPSLLLVDTALARSLRSPAYLPYTGGFEEPFKPIRDARQTAAAGGAAKAALSPVRPKLMLKGVLLKNNPRSILQDESGITFILGLGDTLQGQRVVSIGKASVTLSDKHGSYDLSVKE